MSRSPLAPRPLTMDRLGEQEELVLAQSTSQCCRCCCFQPSINWVMAEGDNFVPGTNPFTLDTVGWIHEESCYCHRTWSWMFPGCRAVKYVQHHGPAPASIIGENEGGWFHCQKDVTTEGLQEDDRNVNVVATHSKGRTCGHMVTPLGGYPYACPVCSYCFPLPYLETTNASTNEIVGRTVYVCDQCCFVPKYDVLDASGNKRFRIRPVTCVCGFCIKCKCDGNSGKCFRVPFYIRNAETKEPLLTGGNERTAQIDNLWSGWKHECCTQKTAYHVAFPIGASGDEKLLLIGSAILVDVTMFEQDE